MAYTYLTGISGLHLLKEAPHLQRTPNPGRPVSAHSQGYPNPAEGYLRVLDYISQESSCGGAISVSAPQVSALLFLLGFQPASLLFLTWSGNSAYGIGR